MSAMGSVESVGRLDQLGVAELWQAALILPRRWDDLSTVRETFVDELLTEGSTVVITGTVDSITAKIARPPRTKGLLRDESGRKIGWTLFGDTRELALAIGSSLSLLGTLVRYGGRWYLNNAKVIDSSWVGRLRPVYEGRGRVIGPATVRERITGMLPTAIPIAADWISDVLADCGDASKLSALAATPEWSIEDLLWHAHLPRTIEEGERAQEGLERLAAVAALHRAKASRADQHATWSGATIWQHRSARLPFRLTLEQQHAVAEILADLKMPVSMRRILSGDVGTGKTAVYAVVAAAAADAGARVAIMLPTHSLAAQVHREMHEWWPELALAFCAGANDAGDIASARIVIGTTALLHRPDLGAVGLLIIDEQQKYSCAQREALARGAHVLEVTATCIPRSQALLRFGVIALSRLTESHTPKRIATHLWERDERIGLFREIETTLLAGHQVLVIYPRRGEEGGDERGGEGADRLPSVVDAYAAWSQRFPGQVRLAHGEMDDTAKESALQDMRAGGANILIATTVVEVGVNLPALRRVVVVHPERFGMTTLHQLRGRSARHGGCGFCDLYMPEPVSEKARERLTAFATETDGFRLAQRDMEMRGFGDLAPGARHQHGDAAALLLGRVPRPRIIEQMISRYRYL